VSIKRTVLKCLLVVCGSMLGFGLLEGGARAFLYLRGETRQVRLDAVYGWKLVAHAHRFYRAEEKPYLVETNARGFRDREHVINRPSGRFRIVFIGDSFVFGSGGVANAERFSDRLERLLSDVESINLGVPGYSLDQEYLLLRNEGFAYRPNLVVLCLFVNDLLESFVDFNGSVGRPKGYLTANGEDLRFVSPRLTPPYRVTQSSYLLSWIDSRFRITMRFHRNPHGAQDLSIAEKSQLFRKLILAIKSLCRENGAELVVVYFPYRDQTKPGIIQAVLFGLADSDGILFLDGAEFLGGPDERAAFFFQRDVHLNPAGHARTARALADYLTAKTSFARFLTQQPSSMLPR
jgi:lysophospholipase L1-like esterase